MTTATTRRLATAKSRAPTLSDDAVAPQPERHSPNVEAIASLSFYPSARR